MIKTKQKTVIPSAMFILKTLKIQRNVTSLRSGETLKLLKYKYEISICFIFCVFLLTARLLLNKCLVAF